MNQIRWDQDREARTGIPEVVYGPGKTSAHLRQIFEGTAELRIASRLTDDQMQVPVSYTHLTLPTNREV